MNSDLHSHSDSACASLIERLLPDLEAMVCVVAADKPQQTLDNDPGGAAPAAPAARSLDADAETVQMLGRALWDVFSNNHRVCDSYGTVYDLGSFRGSASFIAEVINILYNNVGRSYYYLDFYMGGFGSENSRELSLLYRWIFQRLKDENCTWNYTFPRLHLVHFDAPPEVDDFATYDPSDSIRADLERAERAAQSRELEEKLDEFYAEDVRRARHAPLPAIVAAHREVFGALPEGWPHQDM